MSNQFTQNYVNSLQKEYATGNALEHAYRPALKTYLEALLKDVHAVNDPKRQACGAPDYIVSKMRKGEHIDVGYIEAKDITQSLDKTEKGEQMGRYLKSLDNLVIPPFLEGVNASSLAFLTKALYLVVRGLKMSIDEKPKGWNLIHFQALKNPPEWVQKGLIVIPVIVILISLLVFVTLFIKISLNAINDIKEAQTLIFPVLAGLFVAPFLIWRLVLTHKQTVTNEAKKEIDRQVAFTTLYTKSVELLGATRDVKVRTNTNTIPNLEVRLGALHALERLAKESVNDQQAILQVLCAYVRLNSWYNNDGTRIDAYGNTINEDSFNPDDIMLSDSSKTYHIDNALPTRDDVQTAIKIVLKRKDWVDFEEPTLPLNFNGSRWAGFELNGFDIENMIFNHLATINNMRFNGSSLENIQFNYTYLDNNQFMNKCRIKNINIDGVFKKCSQTGFLGNSFYECEIENLRLGHMEFKGSYHFSKCTITNMELRYVILNRIDLFFNHIYDSNLGYFKETIDNVQNNDFFRCDLRRIQPTNVKDFRNFNQFDSETQQPAY